MAYEVKVKIRGISDYLQHKRPFEEDTSRQKSGEVDYSKEAEKSMYFDNEIGCYIPSKQLRAGLVKGAVNFKVKGRMGKTYKDMVNATIEIEPDKIPLGKKTFDYNHQEFVKIQRSQILRSRPAFKKGWEAEFSLLVMDDQMQKDILKEIVVYAGKFVGIGDWRPHFGRFELIEFKE
jgi:hypothetical protein